MVSKSSREAARARAAALRAETARKEKQKKQLLIAGSALLVLIIGVVIAFTVANRPAAGPTATSSGTGSTAYLRQVGAVPAATFDAVGYQPASAASPLQALAGNQPLKDGTKAKVIYVGAEFCPYCATERWALVAALGRFGTWQGLTPARSADNDGNIATVSFLKAKYTSDHVTFTGIETKDRDGNPLTQPPADILSLLEKYDAPPYVNQAGGIPWTYFGNRQLVGTGVNSSLVWDNTPGNPSTVTPDEIAAGMMDGSTPLGKDIISHANLITAQICEQTGQQPANVCTSVGVKAAAAQLPR